MSEPWEATTTLRSGVPVAWRFFSVQDVASPGELVMAFQEAGVDAGLWLLDQNGADTLTLDFVADGSCWASFRLDYESLAAASLRSVAQNTRSPMAAATYRAAMDPTRSLVRRSLRDHGSLRGHPRWSPARLGYVPLEPWDDEGTAFAIAERGQGQLPAALGLPELSLHPERPSMALSWYVPPVEDLDAAEWEELQRVVAMLLSYEGYRLVFDQQHAAVVEAHGQRVGTISALTLFHLEALVRARHRALDSRFPGEGFLTTLGRAVDQLRLERFVSQPTPVPTSEPEPMPTASLVGAQPSSVLDEASSGAVANTLMRILARSTWLSERVPDSRSRAELCLALDIVGAAGCVMSSDAFAKRMGLPGYRVAGFVARLSERVNRDGYRLVWFEPSSRDVRVDKEKLLQLFDGGAIQ